jgi:hypothetical protein
MKVIAKVFVHLLLVLGLLVFIATPVNKYSWMQEMEPSVATLPANEGSGNTIFTALLLVAVVVTQLGIVVTSPDKKERLASIALVLIAISVWLSRFWQ